MVGPHLSWDDKFATNFEEAERNEESEILYKLIDSFEARYGIKGSNTAGGSPPAIPKYFSFR